MAGGKQIEIAANGGEYDAYISVPDGGQGPGVILVTHIFGVDRDTKNMCDNLAEHGCVGLAPNLFWRDQDSGVLEYRDYDRAVARAMRTDFSMAMDDLKSSIAELKRLRDCNGKIALFGFCFGGSFVWRAACDGLGIDAGVSFHGTFLSKSMKPGDRPSCPILFQYGDDDYLAPPPELEAVKKVADATGCEFVIHAGAAHGYMMAGNRTHYHADAARNSWHRALQLISALRTASAPQ